MNMLWRYGYLFLELQHSRGPAFNITLPMFLDSWFHINGAVNQLISGVRNKICERNRMQEKIKGCMTIHIT